MATKKPAPAAKKTPTRRATPKVEENLFDAPQALPHIYPVQLKAKRLSPDAQLPVYATPGSAGFDLHATSGAMIHRGGSKTFDIGLAFEVPPGHVMLVNSRSGHGRDHGVRLANCTGWIDSDYRGPLMVTLHNDGDAGLKIYKGDRIAQAMIVPIPDVEIVEVEELSETQRGAGGHGSTGS